MNLFGQTDNTTWDLYCPGDDCSSADLTQFINAQSAKTAFDLARANAASDTDDGTLTWSQLTSVYGSDSVSVSAPYNTAPEQDRLMLYLNEADHNSPNAMRDATHPSEWKALVDLAIANETAMALWIIQQIQAGDVAKSYLTADLLTAAGVGSTYTVAGVVTQMVAAIDDSNLTEASNVANVSSIESWANGLITTARDATPATSIAKTDSAVSSSGAAIVTSSATPGGGGTLTYSLTGEEASNFSISSSGVVTTASSLSVGTFAFNVVATPSIGNPIAREFTVTVADTAEPVFTSGTSTPNFATNVATGTPLYTAAATDTSNVTYSISGLSGVTIDSSTGIVTRNGSLSSGNNKSFTITATDAANNTATRTVSFNVLFGYTSKKIVHNKCGNSCCGSGWNMPPKSVVENGDFDSYSSMTGNSGYLHVKEGYWSKHGGGSTKTLAYIRSGSWTNENLTSCITSSTCVTACVQ